MKKAYKVLSVLMIVLMMICACTNVFAESGVSIDTIKETGKGGVTGDAADAMNTFGGTILQYVTSAAMVISVVMVAILGIKYMMGRVEEKADYKKSFVPLLVGAVLVFGAATIAKIVIGLANSF